MDLLLDQDLLDHRLGHALIVVPDATAHVGHVVVCVAVHAVEHAEKDVREVLREAHVGLPIVVWRVKVQAPVLRAQVLVVDNAVVDVHHALAHAMDALEIVVDILKRLDVIPALVTAWTVALSPAQDIPMEGQMEKSVTIACPHAKAHHQLEMKK